MMSIVEQEQARPGRRTNLGRVPFSSIEVFFEGREGDSLTQRKKKLEEMEVYLLSGGVLPADLRWETTWQSNQPVLCAWIDGAAYHRVMHKANSLYLTLNLCHIMKRGERGGRPAQRRESTLDTREEQILSLIEKGTTQPGEIATSLGLHPHTISNRLTILCRKLGVASPKALREAARKRIRTHEHEHEHEKGGEHGETEQRYPGGDGLPPL